jgi:hypothetical protein
LKDKLRDDPQYLGHEQTFLRGAFDLEEELTKSTASPTVRRALKLHAARTLPGQTLNVRTKALALEHDYQLAWQDTKLKDFEQQAANAQTPEARASVERDVQGLLGNFAQRQLIKTTDANARLMQFRQDADHRQVLQFVEADPDKSLGWLTEKYGATYSNAPHLTIEQRYTFINRARALSEAKARAYNAEQERLRKEYEELWKAGRERADRELTAKALKGEGTIAELDQLATRWEFTSGQYKAIFDEIKKAPDQASDPALVKHLDTVLARELPQLSEGALDKYYESGRLNRKDYQHYTERLRGQLSAQDAIRRERKGDLEKEYDEARDSIQRSLRTTGVMSMDFDGLGNQLTERALEELQRRSIARRGKEASADVAREIIPRYIAPLQQAAQSRLNAILGPLRYKSLKELTAAYLGKEQDAEFMVHLRALREAESIQTWQQYLGVPAPAPPKEK